MSDPVAAKSGFLCMYMSNHPDTLVSYVKHWGKIKATVASAKMTSIDTQAMSLTYTLKGSEKKNEVRIPFDPPLSGYEEVKPRLLGMKVDAEDALGMSKAPQINNFVVSTQDIYMMTPLMLLLFYTTWAPAGTGEPIYAPGVALRNFVGPFILKASWAILIGAHTLEAVYTAALCRRHQTGFGLGAKYVLTTLAWGFAGWKELRRLIQAERINSIMKGN